MGTFLDLDDYMVVLILLHLDIEGILEARKVRLSFPLLMNPDTSVPFRHVAP